MKQHYVIRNLKKNEIRIAIELAGNEGWNPGLRDAEAFYDADPSGFFVGELDGQPIACISAVNYNNEYGFIGLYIVKESYRNQGYGIKIWEHASAYLGDITCGLDGVPQQTANYQKSGFDFHYKQTRYQAHHIKGSKADVVKEFSPAAMTDIISYDEEVFGTARQAFMRSWLEMDNARAFYVRQGNEIEGYAVLRECLEGYKIGPLFANGATTAETLFLACCSEVEDAPIFLDVSAANKDATNLATKYNMTPVFETARMYKNGVHQFPVEKVYGVTSFELG